ncbi:centriole protein [Haematococcus lacustris]
MPLVLNDDDSRGGSGQNGFDLQTASTLFWKPVPVLLRSTEREDQFEELTFRILTGVSRSNHNMRILRIHISSETDLYFLHSLEVSEEDFQSLKNEQGILVDFASFPGKIITLLDKCTTSQPTDAPRFQAVLSIRGSESLFKIVETNDFKQLPHITLAFRPGNDAAVKQFLAFRLLEVKGNAEDLTTQLARMTAERDTTSTQLGSTQQQLVAVQEQYDKHLLEVQAEAKTQRAAAHEERMREKGELRDAHEREMAEASRKAREVADGLTARLERLDAENRKLREVKYELDSKVSELSHRLGAAEGANKALEDEAGRLRAANQALAAEKHSLQVALNEAKARVGMLEEKVVAQSEVVEQQRSRVRDLEGSVRQLESRCADLRDSAAGHDQRAKDAASEVIKGNQIIEKLTNDLKMTKEKVKRKQAIIVRQEEELAGREASLVATSRDAQGLAQAAENLRSELAGLRSENSELKAKLEDSKSQLQSNEQMIRWLNQQVTEAQLGPTAPGGPGGAAALSSSRYTFRSTAAMPSHTLALTMGAPPTLPSSTSAAGARGLMGGSGQPYSYTGSGGAAAAVGGPTPPSLAGAMGNTGAGHASQAQAASQQYQAQPYTTSSARPQMAYGQAAHGTGGGGPASRSFSPSQTTATPGGSGAGSYGDLAGAAGPKFGQGPGGDGYGTPAVGMSTGLTRRDSSGNGAVPTPAPVPVSSRFY